MEFSYGPDLRGNRKPSENAPRRLGDPDSRKGSAAFGGGPTDSRKGSGANDGKGFAGLGGGAPGLAANSIFSFFLFVNKNIIDLPQ